MVIRQGEVYWVDLPDPVGSGPGYRRPCVVIQNDAVNSSHFAKVIVVVLSTNMKLATRPGNVGLQAGEGGVPKQCVVNVSQITAVEKMLLGERLGQLSRARVYEILDGLRLLTEPRDI